MDISLFLVIILVSAVVAAVTTAIIVLRFTTLTPIAPSGEEATYRKTLQELGVLDALQAEPELLEALRSVVPERLSRLVSRRETLHSTLMELEARIAEHRLSGKPEYEMRDGLLKAHASASYELRWVEKTLEDVHVHDGRVAGGHEHDHGLADRGRESSVSRKDPARHPCPVSRWD